MNKKIFSFKEYGAKWVERNFLFLQNQEKKDKKIYVLGMWPYPSGSLHMGHVRNYTIVDVKARLYKLKDFEVFCPMGWDAFGLPAENAAKEFSIHPALWTDKNIENMKNQLKNLFFIYNWDKEMKTCDQTYYKWQQKLFIEMWKAGYVEKKLSYIDYDPVDKTTLAKEQITADGRGWRSGAFVEKRLLSQWFFPISKFSERLLNDLDRLENKWPSQIITMQRNWIGKNSGYSIKFFEKNKKDSFFEVFTKSPYYLDKVEFLVVAPDSEKGIELFQKEKEIRDFIEKNPRNLKIKGPDMRGFKTSIEVKNMKTGEFIPVYIGNYVLGDYGTGIVMGVPSICKNDHDFTLKNQREIKNLIEIKEDYLENDKTNSEFEKINLELLKDKIIEEKTVYRLKDWCISRQRYWGCPIPIIHCKNCGMLENKDLPVHLEKDMENNSSCFIECWKCGEIGEKEKDTMDTFVDSSWYQYRFPSAENQEVLFDENALKNFPSVNEYVGGPEHAVLHLLFARFFGKVLKDLGYIEKDEPFEKLFTQGMICMETYKTKETQMFVHPESTYLENGKLMFKRPDGQVEEVVVGSYEKMSKSKKNTVDPQIMIDTYGVDALRLAVLSDTPADKDLQWNRENLNGCWSFINRLWVLTHKIKENKNENNQLDNFFTEYALNVFYKIIKNFENYEFNLAVANIRIFVNYVEDNFPLISSEELLLKWIDFLKLVWVICPILGSECLEIFNIKMEEIKLPKNKPKEESLFYQLVVQVNGKKVGLLEVSVQEKEEEVLKKIREQKLEPKEYTKYIFIKNKVFNFILPK